MAKAYLKNPSVLVEVDDNGTRKIVAIGGVPVNGGGEEDDKSAAIFLRIPKTFANSTTDITNKLYQEDLENLYNGKYCGIITVNDREGVGDYSNKTFLFTGASAQGNNVIRMFSILFNADGSVQTQPYIYVKHDADNDRYGYTITEMAPDSYIYPEHRPTN